MKKHWAKPKLLILWIQKCKHAWSHSESRPGFYGSGSEAGAIPSIPSTPHLPCSLSVTWFRRIKAKPFYFAFSISFLVKVFRLVITAHCPHRPRGIWEADRSEPWDREKARPALVLANGRLQGATRSSQGTLLPVLAGPKEGPLRRVSVSMTVSIAWLRKTLL